jgi:putative hydrolase of the HAD superfamily
VYRLFRPKELLKSLVGSKLENECKWLKIQPLTAASSDHLILPVGYTETTMALVNSYDGFIFDYGKVLVHDQTEAERAEMAKIVGIPLDRFEELYWKDRLDYDKGSFTGIEYWQALAKTDGKVLNLDQIDSLISIDSQSWMHFDEPMWQFVEELRAAGKRVAILSNMPMDLGENIKTQPGRFSLFDHVTLSYEVKSVKPEAPIYENCLAGIGTPLKKTVFFDDKIVNVRGAEMLGLDAIEFLDRDTVLKRMRG